MQRSRSLVHRSDVVRTGCLGRFCKPPKDSALPVWGNMANRPESPGRQKTQQPENSLVIRNEGPFCACCCASADINQRLPATAICGLLLAMLLLCVANVSSAQELITNANLAGSTLSQNEARLLFTLRLQHWPDKRPVKVFVLPDNHPLHSEFSKTVLGLFPYQLRRVWDRQVFSGTGQVPVTVDTEEEMLRLVASTPGGIGYLDRLPSDDRVQVIEVR